MRALTKKTLQRSAVGVRDSAHFGSRRVKRLLVENARSEERLYAP